MVHGKEEVDVRPMIEADGLPVRIDGESTGEEHGPVIVSGQHLAGSVSTWWCAESQLRFGPYLSKCPRLGEAPDMDDPGKRGYDVLLSNDPAVLTLARIVHPSFAPFREGAMEVQRSHLVDELHLFDAETPALSDQRRRSINNDLQTEDA